jgi:undecaprenyl-diphosphatase
MSPEARAAAIGLLHGPAELLPISSSGHVTLVPWLAGWDDARSADPAVRKAFEVVLHLGTAAALPFALRGVGRPRLGVLACSLVPPAVVGFALERPIEQRLGTPGTIAAGLVVGALAMALADQFGPTDRRVQDAGWRDGLALGLAQACALVPGISRNGATLAAARARGFARADADLLSWQVAVPVIAGASALKGVRLARRGLPAGTARAFAVGAGGAFASTVVAARVIPRARSLLPLAAYRIGLAGLVARRLWKDRGR